MLSVTALYEYGINNRPHGSSYIRNLLPLSHPSVASGLNVDFSTVFRPCDVLLIDRTWTPYVAPELVEQLVRQARKAGSKIVFSLDDDLLEANAYFPFRRIFSDAQVSSVRYLASRADHVITSTDPLRKRLSTLNPSISVIQNHLDEQLFPSSLPERQPGDRVTIGYMGTSSHEADLLSILEPLRALLSRHRNRVSLELVGVVNEFQMKAMFGDLPVSLKTTPTECVEYPDFVKWMRTELKWDVGLAPLDDTPFTACKSDIKWLDYAFLGIPGIFSRTPAYRDSITDGETGLLVDATPSAWYNALSTMVEDDNLRARIRKAAFKTVHQERSLALNACQWVEALKTAVSRRRGVS